MAQLGTESREDTLCRMYGETVTISLAGRILGYHPNTIRNMLTDGRLSAACEGHRVDMRSIAAYIEAPAQRDEEARVARKRSREGVKCRWTV